MSDATLGEIRMFAGNFTPAYWSMTNGQTVAAAQNTALFSLLSNSYGGDGRTTFKLPDMRGRIPVRMGQGSGLSNRILGSRYGMEAVELTDREIPSHTHTQQASTNEGTTNQVSGNALATVSGSATFYKVPVLPYRQLSTEAIGTEGGSMPHTNMMRYQTLSFIICIKGLYPSRA